MSATEGGEEECTASEKKPAVSAVFTKVQELEIGGWNTLEAAIQAVEREDGDPRGSCPMSR